MALERNANNGLEAMMQPGDGGSDEQVFERFFLATEAARLVPALRSAVPVGAVVPCVRRLVPRVAARVRVPLGWQHEEDIIQEFVCEALDRGMTQWKKGFRFRQYAAFLLYGAANREKRLCRQEDRRRALADVESAEATALNVPDRADQLQTHREILGVLEDLEGKLKISCWEVWVNGRSITETARMLGIAPVTVGVHLHRGRARVLQRLPSYRSRQQMSRTKGRSQGRLR